MRRRVGKDGAFAELETSGAEKIYPSSFNPGAEYSYEYKLNDAIPVFQPKSKS